MLNILSTFRTDDDGAVTIDWVVLTAGVVALALAVVTVVATAATDPATGLGAVIGAREVLSN